jgi:hypothetical protein
MPTKRRARRTLLKNSSWHSFGATSIYRLPHDFEQQDQGR